MIHKTINKFKLFMKKRGELKYIFYDKKEYLRPGKYKFIFEFNVFYNIKSDTSQFPEDIFNPGRKKQWHFKKLIQNLGIFFLPLTINTKITHEDSTNQNGAELVFLTRGENGAKLFNFNEGIVVSVFSDEKDFKKVLDNFQIINKYFQTAVLKIDRDKREIYEVIFEYDSPEEIATKNHQRVILKYLDDLKFMYENQQSQSFINIKDELDKFYNNDYFKELNFVVGDLLKSNSVFNLSIPLFYFKKDLGLGNVLLNNKNYTIIDYDSFDFVSIIQVFSSFINSIERKTNFNAFNLYFSGEFDCYLESFLLLSSENLTVYNRKTLLIFTWIFRLNQKYEQNGFIEATKFYNILNNFKWIKKEFDKLNV